jgi:membrane protein required for colicin V production
MDWYDILMLSVLGLATLFGAWKGMTWQLASLASLVLSYFLALKFSGPLAPLFGTTAPWNRFVAMLAIYIATSIAVWLGFRLVAGVLDKIRLRDFDHQIGGLFGLVKGLLLCLGITFFALGLAPDMRDHIITSRSGHYISALLNNADAVMPPEIHQVLDPYLDKLENRLDPTKPFQPNDVPLPLAPSSPQSTPVESPLRQALNSSNPSPQPAWSGDPARR